MQPILTSILALTLWSANAIGQDFRNLDFRQECDTMKTGLCYWDLSWGSENAVRPAVTDGRAAMLIEGETSRSVGFAEQSASVGTFNDIRIVSLSASIKSENIDGKGAGLNIGLYDDAGQLIASKDMGGFYSIDWIQGTRDWKRYAISIVCPEATRLIRIGAILYGAGRAWIRDLDVEVIPVGSRSASALAERYITAACDTIMRHALVRDSLDADHLRETALKIAGPAESYRDCHLAVSYLLESLRPYGDHHSFFMSAEEMANWEAQGSLVSEIAYPSAERIGECGYLFVPPFHGGNPAQMTAYADSMQRAIETLYRSGIEGWIVDLRQNTGGNMEPMIAGLGPLFSSEKLGSLVDVNGDSESWYYIDGKYIVDGFEGWDVSRPYRVPEPLPIAVLTSDQTGSSGEIVVISFIGNAHTRSFGRPTWGLTTGNGSFELPDGSAIFLASTIMSDRNGQLYTSRIEPDAAVEDDPDTEQDEVLEAALKWISDR